MPIKFFVNGYFQVRKDKIKAKKEEYREILCKEGMSADKFDKLNKLEIKIEVLQSLLEERN